MGISCNSPRIRRGFLVIQLSTERLPRPLRGLAMTNLRTGAVGGAISGRHCPSERAIVKTATAPDLSLRGGAADVGISERQLRFRRGFPVFRACTVRLPRLLRSLAMTSQGGFPHPEGRKGKPKSASLPCHSEERSDVGISSRHYRIRRGFPVFRRVLRDCHGSCGASQ